MKVFPKEFITGTTGIAAISGVTLLNVATLIQLTLQIIIAGLTIYYLIKNHKSHDKTTS